MGHEHSILSDLIGYSLVIYGLFCFVSAMKKPAKPGNTLDCFELFTIYDNPSKSSSSCTANISVSNIKQSQEYNSLQKDCFDALKAIGVKSAKERKYLVHSVFNKHNPTSIQEFLQLAMSK